MQPHHTPVANGHGQTPGIVFVHGTRMSGAYWHGQLQAFSDTHVVAAPDLPGHGTRRETPFSHAGALETIREAIAGCTGGVAVVVGHSLGGYLAMDLLARSPELFRGLVLVGCSAVAQGPRTWPYRAISKLLPLFSDDRLTRWNSRMLRSLYAPELVEPLIASGFGFSSVATSWQAVLGRDHALLLRAYAGPVLVINGERDVLFRSGEQYFVRSCSRGQLKIIRGAAHLCNLDRPEEFTNEVRTFVNSLG